MNFKSTIRLIASLIVLGCISLGLAVHAAEPTGTLKKI